MSSSRPKVLKLKLKLKTETSKSSEHQKTTRTDVEMQEQREVKYRQTIEKMRTMNTLSASVSCHAIGGRDE